MNIKYLFAGVNEQSSVWFKRALIFLLLAFLFFVAGGGVSHNAKWRVTEIRVSGAQVVSHDEIRGFVKEKLTGNYYLVYARDNSYLFSRQDIETGLIEKFLRLATATVNKIDDHTIEATVSERKPVALWCGEVYNREMYELNNCWFIDKTGFVFDRAPIFSEGVYSEVYGTLVRQNFQNENLGGREGVRNDDLFGARLPSLRFDFLHLVEQKLKERLGEPIRAIIKSEGEYGITMRTSVTYPELVGAEIRFKDGTSPDALVKILLSALHTQFSKDISTKKKLLYVDLRFGNKVFFGFEN